MDGVDRVDAESAGKEIITEGRERDWVRANHRLLPFSAGADMVD